MKFNIYLKTFLVAFILLFIASCDKDYNEIGSDIIGDNHYGYDVDSSYTVKTYNQRTGVVQTNNLAINALGYYNHPLFGKTTSNFVTQLELASVDPEFINPTAITIDSVYLYVPYFYDSATVETDAETGDKTYELDSIYNESKKIKLSVYESGYYLRDYNPDGGFQEAQRYYSNQDNLFDTNKIEFEGGALNNSTQGSQNTEFIFSPDEKKITWLDENEPGTADDKVVVKERKTPGMWMDLNPNFFKQKIFNAPSGKLVNNAVFKDYIRGLYFKVEPSASNLDGGAMAMLNFKQGKIVIEYEDATSATDATRKKYSLTINLSGNSVNTFVNEENPTFAAALDNANPTTGDQKLYVRGQQGSATIIDILNQTEINQIKANKWLINEANLTFTIDKNTMAGSVEPNRVYLYDLNNKRPLFDYYLDATKSLKSKFDKRVHSGIIDTQKVTDGRGLRYKIRITDHVRNLILHDSTNVRLGLVVTESINTVSNVYLKNPITTLTTYLDRVPTASVMNPLGTVLFGSATPIVADRPKLKIYYTKPD